LLSPTYVAAPGYHGTLTSDGCDALVQVQNDVVCFPGGQSYQPATYFYTDPSGRKYTIASTGQLQSIRDLNGNTLTYTPSGITSSVGGVVVPFQRDGQNRIQQITDLNGNNYIYTYDGNGNLQSVQYPGLDTPARYTYQTDHSLLTRSDPVGNVTVATYYPDGRLQTFTHATQQNTWTYSYNLGTNTTTTTNPDGGQILETDDTFGKPLTVQDPLHRVTSYTYDSNENMLTMQDPLQKITTYTYDATGFIKSITDPLRHTNTLIYNQYGGILTATDAAQMNTETFTYDGKFNLTQVTDLLNGPNSQLFSATYDSLGDMLSQTDPNGKVTRYTYDPKGNIIQIADALNEVTYITYDAM